MTLGELKSLCEKWGIKDNAKLEFGIDNNTHEVKSFFYVNNTLILESNE